MLDARNESGVLVEELAGTNLHATLFGGQTFRWRQRGPGVAEGLVGDRPVRIVAREGGLEVVALDGRVEGLAEAVRTYFDAGRDYAAAERRLFRDARLRRTAAGLSGIRILRQPPFETLVAFIVSANNNIPRIWRSVEALALTAGRPVETPEGRWWPFPEPKALARFGAARLRQEANLGYRDRYVADAARMVARGEVDLAALERLGTDELVAALRTLPGVGAKVAACVALFAYGRLELFPVDTWVRRAYAALYLEPGEARSDREIAELARRRFGPLAGLAQQYLFESSRRSPQIPQI